MLSLVIASLKARKAAFAGAFLALFCAAALVTACGTLLETGLRGKIQPERYAGARKPRMPSDLEARLLQGSALPIDFLLHDEVRHALRRGFWDALERSRR